LLVLVILIVGFAAAFYTFVDHTSSAIERDKITADALAQAKVGLIGWSAARTPSTSALIPPGLNARPGELPCPDIDNSGTDSGACVAGAIGRVPWKSLGIPEPKDSSGETLWYAIAGPFRNSSMSSAPITSNTLGNMTVYLGSNASTLTSQAVAVIFAPGAALGTQVRSTTSTMACTAPLGTIARNLCASNYLETAGGINNATINGPFIQAQSSPTFNDRVLVITTADLMPLVEQRVAREMIAYLNNYRSTTSFYPWADLGDGNSNGAEGSFAYNRNRFPCGTALFYDWGRLTAPVTPSLPNWLKNGCASLTGWAGVIFYSVATNRLHNSGTGCAPWPNCTASTLTITNASGNTATQCNTNSPPTCTSQVVTPGSADLLLITPGAWDGSTTQTWSTTGWTTISGYFEDSENSNNNDDNYVVPTSTAQNRDRIFIVR
jgi:hypothetical protein